MCLVTARFVRTPLVAEQPILVYKMLKRRPFHYRVRHTPYQDFKIPFKNGTYTLSSELGYTFNIIHDITIVSEGIHAWKRKKWAKESADSFKYYYGDRTSVHYAVIPKGAKYFVGAFDIVSEEMTIFLNKKALKKSEYAYLLKEPENTF